MTRKSSVIGDGAVPDYNEQSNGATLATTSLNVQLHEQRNVGRQCKAIPELCVTPRNYSPHKQRRCHVTPLAVCTPLSIFVGMRYISGDCQYVDISRRLTLKSTINTWQATGLQENHAWIFTENQ